MLPLPILVLVVVIQTAWIVKAGCIFTSETCGIFSIFQSYTWYTLQSPPEHVLPNTPAVRIRFNSPQPADIEVKIRQETPTGRRQYSFEKVIEKGLGHCILPIHSINGFELYLGYSVGLPKQVEVLIIELISPTTPINTLGQLLFSLDLYGKQEQLQNALLHRGFFAIFSLYVTRICVLDITMAQIMGEPNEVMYQRLSVNFVGEDAKDGGGLASEFFTLISHEFMDPQNMMFDSLFESGHALIIRPNAINPNKFEFLGRLMALAIIQNKLLDLPLAKPIWKLILGKQVGLSDLEFVDARVYKSLLDIKDHENVETLALSMPESGDDPLAEDGTVARIPITQDNKDEYIDRIWKWLLKTRIDNQINAIRKGLFGLIPDAWLTIIDEHELELMVVGLPRIDLSVWKSSALYLMCTENDRLVQWFWQIIESWTDDMRVKVLVFVTGSSRMPASWTLGRGKAQSPFIIQRRWFNSNDLPTITCSNILSLPPYKSYNELESKLILAVTEGANRFN